MFDFVEAGISTIGVFGFRVAEFFTCQKKGLCGIVSVLPVP